MKVGKQQLLAIFEHTEWTWKAAVRENSPACSTDRCVFNHLSYTHGRLFELFNWPATVAVYAACHFKVKRKVGIVTLTKQARKTISKDEKHHTLVAPVDRLLARAGDTSLATDFVAL